MRFLIIRIYWGTHTQGDNAEPVFNRFDIFARSEHTIVVFVPGFVRRLGRCVSVWECVHASAVLRRLFRCWDCEHRVGRACWTFGDDDDTTCGMRDRRLSRRARSWRALRREQSVCLKAFRTLAHLYRFGDALDRFIMICITQGPIIRCGLRKFRALGRWADEWRAPRPSVRQQQHSAVGGVDLPAMIRRLDDLCITSLGSRIDVMCY